MLSWKKEKRKERKRRKRKSQEQVSQAAKKMHTSPRMVKKNALEAEGEIHKHGRSYGRSLKLTSLPTSLNMVCDKEQTWWSSIFASVAIGFGRINMKRRKLRGSRLLPIH